MYNFYTLNSSASQTKSSDTQGITIDINDSLTNNDFYSLFDAYINNQCEETENILARHINSIDYLIGLIPDDSNTSSQLKINVSDDLNFLICTTDKREVYLPAFTDSRELNRWYSHPVTTIKVSAKWLWQFVLSQKNFNGIIINPGSIGWDMSLEHIQSLLDDLN